MKIEIKKCLMLLFLAVGVLSLSSCFGPNGPYGYGSPNENAFKGATVGGLLGGVTGAVVGNQQGKPVTGGVIGAATGGAIGGYSGSQVDKQARTNRQLQERVRQLENQYYRNY